MELLERTGLLVVNAAADLTGPCGKRVPGYRDDRPILGIVNLRKPLVVRTLHERFRQGVKALSHDGEGRIDLIVVAIALRVCADVPKLGILAEIGSTPRGQGNATEGNRVPVSVHGPYRDQLSRVHLIPLTTVTLLEV